MRFCVMVRSAAVIVLLLRKSCVEPFGSAK